LLERLKDVGNDSCFNATSTAETKATG